MSFLLEYDTGTEHLPVLAGKLDGYQVLAARLAWHRQVCPVLLFCFGSPPREQAARRALAATREAAALRIATTAIDQRVTSPAGPVWLPLLGHASAAGPPNASGHCAATARTTSPPRRSAGRSSDDAGPDYVSPRVCSLAGAPVPGYLPGSLPAVSTSVRPAGGAAAGQEGEQAAPSLPRHRDNRDVSRSAHATAAAGAAGAEGRSEPTRAGRRDR